MKTLWIVRLTFIAFLSGLAYMPTANGIIIENKVCTGQEPVCGQIAGLEAGGWSLFNQNLVWTVQNAGKNQWADNQIHVQFLQFDWNKSNAQWISRDGVKPVFLPQTPSQGIQSDTVRLAKRWFSPDAYMASLLDAGGNKVGNDQAYYSRQELAVTFEGKSGQGNVKITIDGTGAGASIETNPNEGSGTKGATIKAKIGATFADKDPAYSLAAVHPLAILPSIDGPFLGLCDPSVSNYDECISQVLQEIDYLAIPTGWDLSAPLSQGFIPGISGFDFNFDSLNIDAIPSGGSEVGMQIAIPDNAPNGRYLFRIHLTPVNGDVYGWDTFATFTVPEPSTVLLLTAGFFGLIALRKAG